MGVRLHPSRSLPLIPGVVFDTLVIFSGWEKNNLLSYGAQLPHVAGSGIPAVDLLLDAEASSPVGRPLFATGIYGILASNQTDVCPVPDDISITPLTASTLIMAWQYIETHFDPRGQLIIYGNSAGGDCAMNLCRAITRCKRYYSFNGPTRTGFSAEALTSDVLGQTSVDLLVTVDAAIGPLSDAMSREVPICVKRNENYYQRTAKWEQQFSRGAPNVAADAALTTIYNEDFTSRADHFAMGWMTREKSLAAINACRNSA